MTQPPFFTPSCHAGHPLYGRRRDQQGEALLLTELNPHSVVDCPADRKAPLDLQSFGTVREPCPKCQKACLNLILRQAHVHTAHLLCLDCHSCYDAHYAGGAPALTI
jgi:hypothetical protein